MTTILATPNSLNLYLKAKKTFAMFVNLKNMKEKIANPKETFISKKKPNYRT